MKSAQKHSVATTNQTNRMFVAYALKANSVSLLAMFYRHSRLKLGRCEVLLQRPLEALTPRCMAYFLGCIAETSRIRKLAVCRSLICQLFHNSLVSYIFWGCIASRVGVGDTTSTIGVLRHTFHTSIFSNFSSGYFSGRLHNLV